MKPIYFIMILSLTALGYGCKREDRLDHLDSSAPAPAQISDVKVEETPGGAVLTYTLPKDPNLSYVKAEYEIQPGVMREAKSSYYKDTLTLVGFGDTLSHEVKLYSVGKNEKASEPLSVNVTPLTPPVRSVFRTLSVDPTFGGVQINFRNSSQANLAIAVMLDTTGLGTWSTISTFYTGALEGKFSVRGFDSTEKRFAVYIRDRWNNKSDTITRNLSPIYEEEIPKNTWKALFLPTDTYQPASPSYSLEHLWDNIITNYDGIFASSNSSQLPQWFTVDLGRKVVISRIVEHQQQTSHIYAGSAVKSFVLYGSNSPNADGSWASWDSLGTFNSFKPSGLPMGSLTDEDREYGWRQGEDFAFDQLLPAYRYIRWKTLETWGGGGQVVISELDVWGQVQP
ncbi:DUF5000 domain-containing lipoprotein [Compostibacter hankyongensis]